VCFFFSSRRRHTRWPRDWSSDVCSSDLDGVARDSAGPDVWLGGGEAVAVERERAAGEATRAWHWRASPWPTRLDTAATYRHTSRSEERRVGKECRTRWCAE